MILLAILVPIVRRRQGKTVPSALEFFSVGFAASGVLALLKVSFKVLTEEKLQDDLDLDGTIAFLMGSGLGIYLSLKEIIKLF
jgi:hypothetical protein